MSDLPEKDCCRNCKHRLGEKGDEMEIKHCGYGINLRFNCARAAEMFRPILPDPYAQHGLRAAFNQYFCCNLYESKDEEKNEAERESFSI